MTVSTSELKGQTFFITGANAGIGRVTALELAQRGATLIMAGRSEVRTIPVMDEIESIHGTRPTFLPLDLGDLDSVNACADQFLATDHRLDVLINNAGVAGTRGRTKDGFELAFGVNHLGHFLLTHRLLPRMRATQGPSRIVNVASQAHYRVEELDFVNVRLPTESKTGLPEYSVSKLCNILFTKRLARELENDGIQTYALHPGVVASDIWRRIPWPFRNIMKLFMISNEDGALTTLYCATDPEIAAVSGRYYDTCKEKTPSALAEDAALADTLWEKSLSWTGINEFGA